MKDIKGYEGLYAITEDGKVWSYKRNKYLIPEVLENGYLRVSLSKDGKYHKVRIHTLVANAYLDNPNGYEDINHKDENKENNSVSNLEWVSHKDNCNYGTRNNKIRKAVYCVELDKVYESQSAAAKELGLWQGNIGKCCNGIWETTGGYHWKFV